MERTHTRDLTSGSPTKLLLIFLVPILLTHLLQRCYSIADGIIVGRYLGAYALAGIGSTGAVNFLVMEFLMGVCAGFAIPVAQAFGRKDYDGLRRVVGNTLWLSGIIAVILTTATVSLCRPILEWMHNPPETFQYSYTYLVIIFLGIPASTMYHVLAGIIRALGDSKTPLLFLIISGITNILLDFIMIAWLHWDIAGAAIATVLSQVLSATMCLIHIIRRFPILHLRRSDWCLRQAESRLLLGISLPMGLQYSITGIGSMLLQSSVNALGASAMAAMAAGDKIHGFLLSPLEAMGAATATYVGQNVGAGKLNRIHAGNKANSILGLSYCAVIFAVAWFFGDHLVSIFLDSSETEIIAMAHQYIWANASSYGLLLYILILRFSIQGMGFSSRAIFAGMMELIGRGAFALFVVPHLGFQAIGFAAPFAWLLGDCFLVPMYFICIRKLRRRQTAAIQESSMR